MSSCDQSARQSRRLPGALIFRFEPERFDHCDTRLSIIMMGDRSAYAVYEDAIKEVHGISRYCPLSARERGSTGTGKKVADIHAQTVMEMVKSMAFPAEQKIRLINAIKSYIPQ